MSESPILYISPELAVPRAELEYRASRSGGPGGQHVNTSSTRIELLWNLAASPALSEEQRARLTHKLAGRIDQSGTLRVVASTHRSQFQNKQEATERFRTLVAEALRLPRRRKKTRPSRAAKEARLKTKKRRSHIKSGRGRVKPEE